MTTEVDSDALPQEIVPSVSEDAVMDESEEAKTIRAVKQGSLLRLLGKLSDSSYSRVLFRGF